eukprot:6197166-Pleurochrysis_carterae.AAC.1
MTRTSSRIYGTPLDAAFAAAATGAQSPTEINGCRKRAARLRHRQSHGPHAKEFRLWHRQAGQRV